MGNFVLTSDEQYLFAQGTYYHSFLKFGAHPYFENEQQGYHFQVWCPNVKTVSVVGDFNNWNINANILTPLNNSGIWYGFIPNIRDCYSYKYAIMTTNNEVLYKADPYAFYAGIAPETTSMTFDIDNFAWQDDKWLKKRKRQNKMTSPLNIYEVHLGSWKTEKDGSHYSYQRLTQELIPYVKTMGYTHIELMPVMEHPFGGSWGYQITGYYAPTSRYGNPKEFMQFINTCHLNDIGVILDWVPGHFCRDAHGLGRFNGKKMYESSDHEQWGTYNFDYSKGQVLSFLISNAFYWLEKYHIDGFRMDGVTSMLYLNYGSISNRKKRLNIYGKEENLDAINFIQNVNTKIGIKFADVIMIAEESTAWPLVTYPPDAGGLGFHFKWDMGWMNDTLNYIKTDFPYRYNNHNLLTFSMMYAFNENFILPLSHDEVVHGKASLIGRMPGDYWKQFAGLRLLALYQICHPGAKLSFMGNEFAQFIEWRYYETLEWFLLKYDSHRLHQAFVAKLNHLYLKEKALFELDHSWAGFDWIDADNSDQSVLIFKRCANNSDQDLIIVLNFLTDAHEHFRIGVDSLGTYKELLNTDDQTFGGSNVINKGKLKSENVPFHKQPYSLTLRIPPIGGLIIKKIKNL